MSNKLQPIIAPSILAANFARLGEEVQNVLNAGADWIHFDVMDNHFVPNLTIGPMVCEAIRPFANKDGKAVCIDVHLMVEPVDRLIPDFAKAGSNLISFHPEASPHIDRSLGLIKELGCQSGLVLNPATPLQYLDFVLDKIDLVLLMSVNPGFGGQQFIPSTLEKITQTKKILDAYAQKSGRQIRLEVDGGINTKNIGAIYAAGADTFVAGSAIFGQANYTNVIAEMRQELARVQ